jgi:hypothetical protein
VSFYYAQRQGLAAVLDVCVSSAWQLKPIRITKYKTYSNADEGMIGPKLKMIRDVLLMVYSSASIAANFC